MQDPRIVLTGGEDATIGRAFRPLLEREYGIRFASEALADEFAFEAAYPIGKPFGFHGLFNFCRIVPPNELSTLVRHFAPPIVRSPQLLQLGRNCIALGQWQAAAAIFRRILDEDANHAEAAAGLETATANAATLPAAGRNEPCPCGSGKRYKNCHGVLGGTTTRSAAAWLTPDQRVREALVLHKRGDTDAAEQLYCHVLETQPNHALAQHFLGVIYYQRQDLERALPLLEASIARQPSEPEFHNNLGLALAAADRDIDAVAAYRAALALKPAHAVAWNNLGLALQSCNDVGGAIAAFRHAVELEPEFAQAQWNLSLALLLDGQYAEGWRQYDWRLALPQLGRYRHTFPGPQWDGTAPAGKTLLLYAEQGLGDALQFARFVTPLSRAGARCLIHCPEALASLLATIPGAAAVYTSEASLPRFDAHLSLLSLPRVLGTTIETIPSKVPYIAAVPERRAAARTALEPFIAQLKVGLAWAGNRAHANDRKRSCPLAMLAPLFGAEGIAWFSLQKGDAAEELMRIPDAEKLIPLSPDAAFADTAALISELDLVISVCTSIANVAGALGRPLWVMLPYVAEWRWLRDREDSPWYPTARLFRQTAPGDWSSVAARMAAELQAHVEVHHGPTRDE